MMGNSTKTRKFLIATHGTFAQGIKSSLDIIAGPQENIFLIEAYLDDINSIEAQLDQLLKDRGENEEWIVFSDLLGGSITNQLVRYISGENVYIIAGFNLPLLLELVLSDTEIPVEAVIEDILGRARDQMVYVNKLLQTQHKGDDND